jgi:hypothetical protein
MIGSAHQDLKWVSLAYPEGSFRSEGQTRIRAAVVGGSGVDLVVDRASTRASHQLAHSERLTLPVKWSYRKLLFWSVLVFMSGVITAVVFAALRALVVRHNQSVYPKRLAEWDSSFLC